MPIPPVGLIADRGRRQDPRIPLERVRTLQRHLAWLGFEPGPVDGRYGPLTTGAVMRFQQAHDLPVDGQVGALTVSAMRAERPTTAHVERIKALQTHLTWLALDPGPIDGNYGPRTASAVAQFQRTHNLNPNGRVDPDTASAIRTIILERPHGTPTHQRSEQREP
jgi:peptidoglycan hydrolase-like protein with peptidoglycan-binding domain